MKLWSRGPVAAAIWGHLRGRRPHSEWPAQQVLSLPEPTCDWTGSYQPEELGSQWFPYNSLCCEVGAQLVAKHYPHCCIWAFKQLCRWTDFFFFDLHVLDEAEEVKPFAGATHSERRGNRRHGENVGPGAGLPPGSAGVGGSWWGRGLRGRAQVGLERSSLEYLSPSAGMRVLLSQSWCVGDSRGEGGKKEAWFLILSSVALHQKAPQGGRKLEALKGWAQEQHAKVLAGVRGGGRGWGIRQSCTRGFRAYLRDAIPIGCCFIYLFKGWEATLEERKPEARTFGSPPLALWPVHPLSFTLSGRRLTPAILTFLNEDLAWVIGPIWPRARLPEAVGLVEGLLPEALAARESLSVTYSCLSCWRDHRKFKNAGSVQTDQRLQWHAALLFFWDF